MKKIFALVGFVLFCSIFCFAETEKFRYVMITDQALMVVDLPKQLPEEALNDKCFSANTKKERMSVEYGVNKIKSYYYSGAFMLVYADYSKDMENPDMNYIDSWDELIAYIRGTK